MEPENAIILAVVCSSNQNRSMEAHHFLSKRGFNVKSFGTGNQVKLPGSSADKPNTYEFGTPYEYMYQDLVKKDRNLYTQNGMLHMLDRNRRIKLAPERFQDNTKDRFNVILTCEERVYDQVVEDMMNRQASGDVEMVHIVNIDIVDNHEEATVAAFQIGEMCQRFQESDDLDDDMDEILQEFEEKYSRPLLHTVSFY